MISLMKAGTGDPLSVVMMVALLLFAFLCLAYRHLHQTGSFSMDNIEQPFQKSSEGLEEDITDKVPVCVCVCVWNRRRLCMGVFN